MEWGLKCVLLSVNKNETTRERKSRLYGVVMTPTGFSLHCCLQNGHGLLKKYCTDCVFVGLEEETEHYFQIQAVKVRLQKPCNWRDFPLFISEK